jgi:hypothetical protein
MEIKKTNKKQWGINKRIENNGDQRMKETMDQRMKETMEIKETNKKQ